MYEHLNVGQEVKSLSRRHIQALSEIPAIIEKNHQPIKSDTNHKESDVGN
jgi:hypothetical protein